MKPSAAVAKQAQATEALADNVALAVQAIEALSARIENMQDGLQLLLARMNELEALYSSDPAVTPAKKK